MHTKLAGIEGEHGGGCGEEDEGRHDDLIPGLQYATIRTIQRGGHVRDGVSVMHAIHPYT